VVPALHLHAAANVLPASDMELYGHTSHVALPRCALYVFIAHRVHVPPSGPVEPALHAHAAMPGLAAGLSECIGQVSHTTAPSVAEYLPAAQLVQRALPFTLLYVPASHIAQDSFAVPVYPAPH